MYPGGNEFIRSRIIDKQPVPVNIPSLHKEKFIKIAERKLAAVQPELDKLIKLDFPDAFYEKMLTCFVEAAKPFYTAAERKQPSMPDELWTLVCERKKLREIARQLGIV